MESNKSRNDTQSPLTHRRHFMNLYLTMNIKDKIGNRIKFLRNELKISQEELGFRSNVDRTYVTDVENGRRNISVEVLEKLIKGLNTTFNDFFNTQDYK